MAVLGLVEIDQFIRIKNKFHKIMLKMQTPFMNIKEHPEEDTVEMLNFLFKYKEC